MSTDEGLLPSLTPSGGLSFVGLVIILALPAAASAILFLVSQQLLALLPAIVSLLLLILLHPRQFVLVLPFLGAMSGWYLHLYGRNVRPDQALAAVLILPLFLGLASHRIRWRKSKLNMPIYLFLLANLVSSLMSKNPTASLLQLLNISTSVAIYFVVMNLIRSEDEYRRFFTAMLAAGFVSMSYGLLLFIVGVGGVDIGGVNLEENTWNFGIYGSMREPNIFGSYSASMLMVGLTLCLGSRNTIATRRCTPSLPIVAAICLVLSYARAAWVGAVTGLLVLAFYRKSGIQLLSPKVAANVALILLVVVLLFSFGIIPSSIYTYKITNIFNFEEGTGGVRRIDWLQAWANFVEEPIFGNGTFSYSYLNEERGTGERPEESAWISNLPLLVLHDTGLVGMAAFVILIWALVRVSRITLRNASNGLLKLHALGYLAAMAALLVAFLATSAFSYGYTWIFISMIAQANALSIDDSRREPV